MQSEKWNLNRLDLWGEVALNLLNEAGAVFKGDDSYLAPRPEAAPPAPSVAVKALDWSRTITDYGHSLKAYDPFGRQAYYIRVEDGTTEKYISEAKAYFQADYEARIRSALSAQVQDVAGWQPIETAPKDGTNILVWADGYQWPEVVRYEIYDDPIVEAEAGEKGYWRFSEDLLA